MTTESELEKNAFEVDYATPLLERIKSNADKKYIPKTIHLNGKLSLTVESIKKWLEEDLKKCEHEQNLNHDRKSKQIYFYQKLFIQDQIKELCLLENGEKKT